MHTNYTLKQAVKTAIIVLAMSAQANVYALGLGNIEVNSHLGQPLRASVKVQGASELKNVDCIRVINDASAENQISTANFKLSKVVDDVAILTISTNQVMNEPIVNLSIMAECNANMRRDYVLLLDPLMTAEVENSTENAANTEFVGDNDAAKESVAKDKRLSNTQSVANNAQTVKAKQPSSKTTAKKVKKSNNQDKTNQGNTKTNNTNVVLSAGYASTNNNTKPKVVTEKETKPRLTISSGDFSAMPLTGAKLQLDKQLHFTPENAPLSLDKALAEDSEIQDEVTVMNNRMAHLTKQINDLALANQTLKTDNQTKTQQLNDAQSTKNSLDWLGYILGGALVFSSFSIANKWRQRRQYAQFEDTELAWEDTNQKNTDDTLGINDSFFDFDKDQAFNKDIEDTTQHFDINELEPESAPSSSDESATPFSVEEFNAEHNILDHADVFLSHGRTSLAIQLLQNHLIDHPKQSVTVWLFLLDLLAKDNMQAMYEQTALECKEHYNIRIAAFSNDEASSKQHLEDFPRLHTALQEIWGTPAALVFLDDLIYNSRLESRVGFEKSVIEELLLLKNIAHESTSSAQVIQMDEKKMALKEQKEAKLAASKAERLQKLDELVLVKSQENQARIEKESNDSTFEFNLVEYK
jgi:hypothetical protein